MLKKWGIKVILAVSVLINGLVGWNYYSGNIVSRVIDGDTFDLKNGTRVRLLDLQSPETGFCGYDESKKRLEELILGKFVVVRELAYEPFNRDQGLIYQGNKLINEIMLREGWGRLEYNPNSQLEKLKAAYKYAKENKQGIFSLGCQLAQPAGECKIKGNIDEDTLKKSYHLTTCRDYDRVKIDQDRGEKFFCTEAQAKAAGYQKAYGCE